MDSFRSSEWISESDLVRALPNRQPKTAAAEHATKMMTFGGNPHPTKQIQQGPGFCSACGKSHQLGNVCSKALEHAFDVLFKGVIMSGNKKGNPAHDSSTGHFASSQHATSAHEKGDVSEPKRGRSPEGKARAAAAKETAGGGAPSASAPAATATQQATSTLQDAAKPAAAEDVGRAPTMMGAAPAPPERGAAPSLEEAGRGAGKDAPTGAFAAPKKAAPEGATDLEMRAPEKAEAAHASQMVADNSSKMSAQIKQKRGDVEAIAMQAYADKRKELHAAGVPEDAAHEQAKEHAGKVWDENQANYFAQRGAEHKTMQGQAPGAMPISGSGPKAVPRRQQIAEMRAKEGGGAPSAPAEPGVTRITNVGGQGAPQGPMKFSDLAKLRKPGAQTSPDAGPPTMAGSASARQPTMAGAGPSMGGQTAVSGPPTMGGQTLPGGPPPNMMKPSATIPGMGPTPTTPAVPSIPGTPGGAAPQPPTAPGTAPGAPGTTPGLSGRTPPMSAGTKQRAGGGLTPWAKYSTGSAIGSGMWTAGGTVQPTASAAVQGVHGLLGYRDTGINPAGSAAKQSAALQNETQRATAALSNHSARIASANRQGRYASP